VAQKVFFHIGLPKTGTTYLQTIMWNNCDELLQQGVLLPGASSRQHLWASGVVRQDENLDRRGPDAKNAWSELVEEVNLSAGTAVISHEFFAGASADQVAGAIADLAGAEVHVVVTARDALSLVTARWQEFVKNGSTVAIDDYPLTDEINPQDEWNWGTLDVGDVLRRWGAGLPPEHVHVLTLPKPTEPRETLWLRFATLVGIDPASCDSFESAHNESLGVVEVELLRRINGDLAGFGSPLNRGMWIRGYLAQGKLVPRIGEKFWPSAERVESIRARGEQAVALIRENGYDVIGDVEDLLTPYDLPPRRHPSSVTDTEMLAVATSTIAAMLTDVRQLTNQPREPAPVPIPEVGWIRGRIRLRERLRRAADRVSQMWSRSQRR
jgi:hypothetical protein